MIEDVLAIQLFKHFFLNVHNNQGTIRPVAHLRTYCQRTNFVTSLICYKY